MNIRLGTKADAPEVAKYLKEMWLMHCTEEPKYVSAAKIGAYKESRITKYLKDCFNKSGKSYLLIAEEGKEIAGFLKIDITKIESFYIQTKVLFLDDIFVKDKYRKQGIAKKLILEAEEIAKKKKIKWLKCKIYEFNKPAQEMVKSRNFKALYSEYFKII